VTVAPDAGLIADSFVEELVSVEETAHDEDQPSFIYLFDSGTAVMIDSNVRWQLLRQVVEHIHRQSPAGTIVASSAAVAERLREHWADSVMDLLQQRDERLGVERQMAEMGHELPEGSLDPDDPAVILRDLPQEHREGFMHDYMGALRAARDPRDYRMLQQVLRIWRTRADWYSDPAYQSQVAALERGERPTGSRSWSEIREGGVLRAS
jgi:Family of unknown function (DUF6247)